jgi:hypothetical protein
VEGLSHLKTFHEIPGFRIGGVYDLDDRGIVGSRAAAAAS